MLTKKSDIPDKTKEEPQIKNAVPAWVSITSISITAFIVGFILMRI